MLHLLDETLEAFLRAEVPLSSRQIDVSFEAPDSDWGARVNKPTVNLFLWDVRNNVEQREAGVELVEGENGKRFRARPKPRVDCHYLVTAWTSEVKDEHQLLGSLLSSLLGHHEIAEDYLRGAYESVRPLPALQVALPDGKDNSDFWSALGGKLKPGLDLIVTATVDLDTTVEAGPPVESYDIAVGDSGQPDTRSTRSVVAGDVGADAAGRVVLSPRGRGVVDESGRFFVEAGPGDEITIEGEPKLTKKVDEQGTVRAGKRDAKT
jgi:Pvc16 N-terminal domain